MDILLLIWGNEAERENAYYQSGPTMVVGSYAEAYLKIFGLTEFLLERVLIG